MTPLEKVAYDIGAKGSEPTENERLAFESWMRGHCWAVIGEWDGKQYKHAHESTGFVHGGAMDTRRLWAAWRDRGAVARVLAEQAQAVEPVTDEKEIQHINTKNCHWVAKSEFVSQSYKETGRTRYFSTNQPSPPPAGEPVARVAGVDEYGPRIDWFVHWAKLHGANLYAEPPVQQVAVPAGMELVPIEPTLEMIMAMEYEWMYGSNSDMAKREYKAMLAAAQGAKQ